MRGTDLLKAFPSLLLLLFVGLGATPVAHAEVQLDISESGLQKLLESSLAPLANDELSKGGSIDNDEFKMDGFGNVRFARNGDAFSIANGPAGKDVFGSKRREADLSVRFSDGEIHLKFTPARIDITGNELLIKKFSQTLDIPIGPSAPGRPAKTVRVSLKDVPVRIRGLRFTSDSGMDFEGDIPLSSSNEGGRGVPQLGSARLKVGPGPEGFDVDFKDLDLDVRIPGFQVGPDAYQVIRASVRDYLAKNKASISALASKKVSQSISDRINEAVRTKVNPELRGLQRVSVTKDLLGVVAAFEVVEHHLKIVAETTVCPDLIKPDLIEKEPSRVRPVSSSFQVDSRGHDFAVMVDAKSISDITSALTRSGALPLDWSLGGGRRLHVSKPPELSFIGGKMQVKLHGTFSAGNSADDLKVTAATGLSRIEYDVQAQVHPELEGGKFKLVLDQVQRMGVAAVSGSEGAHESGGGDVSYRALDQSRGEISLESRFVESLVSSLFRAGKLPVRVLDGKIAIASAPRVTFENGKIRAQVDLVLNIDGFQDIPDLKKIEKYFTDDKGQPKSHLRLSMDVEIAPSIVVDGKTGRRYLKLSSPVVNGASATDIPEFGTDHRRHLAWAVGKVPGGYGDEYLFFPLLNKALSGIKGKVQGFLSKQADASTGMFSPLSLEDPALAQYTDFSIGELGAEAKLSGVRVDGHTLKLVVETTPSGSRKPLVEVDQGKLESKLQDYLHGDSSSALRSSLRPIHIVDFSIEDGFAVIRGDLK